mmetsp:Transcript_21159/g.55996  ORF Transcript_21159/g.55996 Transcript_21159/m.55996 type:complete len:239 (+) Transcript_21159:193-909(+)
MIARNWAMLASVMVWPQPLGRSSGVAPTLLKRPSRPVRTCPRVCCDSWCLTSYWMALRSRSFHFSSSVARSFTFSVSSLRLLAPLSTVHSSLYDSMFVCSFSMSAWSSLLYLYSEKLWSSAVMKFCTSSSMSQMPVEAWILLKASSKLSTFSWFCVMLTRDLAVSHAFFVIFLRFLSSSLGAAVPSMPRTLDRMNSFIFLSFSMSFPRSFHSFSNSTCSLSACCFRAAIWACAWSRAS